MKKIGIVALFLLLGNEAVSLAVLTILVFAFLAWIMKEAKV